jgi:hypothetical protein
VTVRFLAEGIWKEITAAVKRRRGKAFVAVPYFGQAGSRLLPLRKGDMLVVNASEAAVRSGQTYPDGLRRLLNRGVQIYSLDNLHAKVYVLGSVAFIGSANASSRSSEGLEEAVVQVRDSKVIEEARRHVLYNLCKERLSRTDLDRLKSKYRPPRLGGHRTKASRPRVGAKARWFIVQLKYDELGEEQQEALDVGEQKAEKLREEPKSTINSMWWRRDVPYRKGDMVIQVVESKSGAIGVYAPAKVISRREIRDGRHRIRAIYVEATDEARRRLDALKKKIPAKYRARLEENGRVADDDFRVSLIEALG